MTTPLLTNLDDVTQLDLPAFDEAAAEAARARQAELTKPQGSLGRLEDMAVFMAGWRGTPRPKIDRAQSLVFAGNHGVCDQGVNPYPQAVTAIMVQNFSNNGAAINQLCRVAGSDLSVIALDLDNPTADFTTAPAMTEAEALDAFNRGAAAVDPSADVLTLGEMGIGNSTISAALALGLFGGAAEDWVGRGTGSDEAGLDLKRKVIAKAVDLHKGVSPMQTLAALGGREQAAICGAVVAARMHRIPVMLDGYICTAAVTPLFVAEPSLLDHCMIGHRSAEPGHIRLCEKMDKEPVLNFHMALGEGTGAALALQILKGAVACHDGMATFAEAGIG